MNSNRALESIPINVYDSPINILCFGVYVVSCLSRNDGKISNLIFSPNIRHEAPPCFDESSLWKQQPKLLTIMKN